MVASLNMASASHGGLRPGKRRPEIIVMKSEADRRGGSAWLRTDELKESAARAALDLVKDGMRLGLGTGSTAARFVAALGERVAKRA